MVTAGLRSAPMPQTGDALLPAWAVLARETPSSSCLGSWPQQDLRCRPEPTRGVVPGHVRSPAGPRCSPCCSSPSSAVTWDVRATGPALRRPQPDNLQRELGLSLLQVGRSDCGPEDIGHLVRSLRPALPGCLQQVGHVRQQQALSDYFAFWRVGDVSLGRPKVHTAPCRHLLKNNVQMQEEEG